MTTDSFTHRQTITVFRCLQWFLSLLNLWRQRLILHAIQIMQWDYFVSEAWNRNNIIHNFVHSMLYLQVFVYMCIVCVCIYICLQVIHICIHAIFCWKCISFWVLLCFKFYICFEDVLQCSAVKCKRVQDPPRAVPQLLVLYSQFCILCACSC